MRAATSLRILGVQIVPEIRKDLDAGPRSLAQARRDVGGRRAIAFAGQHQRFARRLERPVGPREPAVQVAQEGPIDRRRLQASSGEVGLQLRRNLAAALVAHVGQHLLHCLARTHRQLAYGPAHRRPPAIPRRVASGDGRRQQNQTTRHQVVRPQRPEHLPGQPRAEGVSQKHCGPRRVSLQPCGQPALQLAEPGTPGRIPARPTVPGQVGQPDLEGRRQPSRERQERGVIQAGSAVERYQLRSPAQASEPKVSQELAIGLQALGMPPVS